MSEQGISFIVPFRERKEHLPGFLCNIKKYYKNFEIILACQDDNLLFRKGQLSNLGWKKAKYNVLAFINLDYRFMSYVDILQELIKYQRPICTFSLAARVKDSTNGNLVVTRKPTPSPTAGGCTVFTKEQWLNCHGNSNLIIGWGPDDNLLFYRTNMIKLPDVCMGHIVHGKGGHYFSNEIKSRNQNIKMLDPQKDPSKDGFEQTIADESEPKLLELNVTEYKFKNIRVPDNFEYMTEYNEGLKLERKLLHGA